MESWYVAAAQRGRELSASEIIKERGFTALVPCVALTRRTFGRSQQPLFPGYVFIRMDLDAPPPDAWAGWQGLNGVRGIIRLLPMHAERPLELPDGFVEMITGAVMRGDFNKKTVEEIVAAFVRDQELAIESGPFAGFTGKFRGKERGKIKLLVSLLGAEHVLKVPARQLAAISAS